MKIGIDISQLAYPNTGVATFLRNLIEQMLILDQDNEYVLFFSSLRKELLMPNANFQMPNVHIKKYKIPPTILSFLWNKLHIAPIEWFVGNVDVFITSDWTEPPVRKAKKVTILYDLIVYKYPNETDSRIISTQKRKLKWVVRESSKVLCISESTKKDAIEILGVDINKLEVIYPGL